MKAAPILDTEIERLRTLLKYQILDTAQELAFDDLTALAAVICGCPISTISLIDEKRQWFKSTTGLEKSFTEGSRDISFCGHALYQTDVFEVEDATLDDRFADNPLVTGGIKIRFYAAAPLVAPNGHAIGTLCVVGNTPHRLSDDQKEALQRLARQVMAQIELRKRNRDLSDHLSALQKSTELVLQYQQQMAEASRFTSNSAPANKVVIDAGDEQLVEADVQKVVGDTLKPFNDRFKTMNVDVQVDVEPITLSCKPVHISQILTSLLESSIETVSGQTGGWIRISGKSVSTGVEISIVDSGKGISKEFEQSLSMRFCVGLAEYNKGRLTVDKTSEHTKLDLFVPHLQMPEHVKIA